LQYTENTNLNDLPTGPNWLPIGHQTTIVASAQINYGSIGGTVLDPGGVVVPGAKVVATYMNG
jgi:hypothetical protein